MKRFLLLIVSLFLVPSLLFAAGSPESDEVTLTYAIWDQGQADGMNAIARAFEAQNPGIKIDVQVTPWTEYWTKLEAGALGGAMPDVFWNHVSRYDFYQSSDLLLDLTDIESIDYTAFSDAVNADFSTNGRNYGVPKDYGLIVLYYNRALFDNAGVPYPDASWTWDTVIEQGRRIVEANEGIYAIAGAQSGQNGYENIIPQFGGFIISEDKSTSGYDQPEAIEAVQMIYDLIHVHQIHPTLEELSDTSQLTMFTTGRVAMLIEGNWHLKGLSDNEDIGDVFDLSVYPGQVRKSSLVQGLANSVAASTDYPDEAKLFIAFLGSEEGQRIHSESGAAISAYQGTQQPYLDLFPDKNAQAIVDTLEFGVPMPTSPTRAEWTTEVNDIMVRILSNQIDLEEGLREAARQMNETLATE